MSLTSRSLTWPVDGLVGLWCSLAGVVPSAVPANFYPPSGRNPICEVGFMYVPVGYNPSTKHDLGTLRGENPYSIVGPPSGENVEFGRILSGRNPSCRVMMRIQTCNDAT